MSELKKRLVLALAMGVFLALPLAGCGGGGGPATGVSDAGTEDGGSGTEPGHETDDSGHTEPDRDGAGDASEPGGTGDEDTSGPDEPSLPVEPGEPGTGATAGVSIAWGPRLAGSGLSALSGGNDVFGPAAAAGLAAAAGAAPALAVNGVSQSSLVSQAVDGMRVRVARDDDGNLVYELTDGGVMVVHVPSSIPRLGFGVAVFSDLMPGIEPDLSSYPHDLLGMWEWEGAVGAFWGRSPSIPGVSSTGISPSGTATYEGDAVGLHAVGGGATKFLADIELVADFAAHTVGGTVDGFRSFAGESLGALTVTLGETGFSAEGDPFSGETTATTAADTLAGGGQWGGRWSDGDGWAMGGTFGFAANDARVGVLGAFTASSGASGDGGNPDDPVSTGP